MHLDRSLFHPTAHPSSIPPPTDVSVTKLTSTSASVSWTPAEGVPPFLYFICAVPIETNEQKKLGVAVGTESSYTQNGLTEGRAYIIVVIARGATTSAADAVVFTSGIL